MRNKFGRGLLIYSLVLLLLGGVGLGVLWNYLRAYEDSRSQYVVEDFIGTLTAQDVVDGAQALLEQVDPNVQSLDAAAAVIRAACEEPFRAVKDPTLSTENLLRYRIRSGKREIGSFTLMVTDRGAFGLPQWTVTKSTFDLSELIGPPVSLTVDQRAQVCLEGKPLPERYITQREIPYALFDGLENTEIFPQQVTYTVEHYLGEIQWQVLDEDGQDVTGQDYESVFLKDNCGEDTELEEFLNTFVKRYIAFSGSTKSTARGNLASLRKLIVSDSALYTRLASALDGLSFGQSVRDNLADIRFNHRLRLEENLYFCDITYLVDTTGKKGVVQTTNNVKLLVCRRGGSLKVRELCSY